MDIPYTVKARPDTGLWNAKIAIWLFLASEVMLFGGLFSAYIFLRIASDTPWPTQVLSVKAGFINTLILIFSSITVLQAWLSLKMRKYGRYQIYMSLTLLASVVFMGIKLSEYNDKFHHYGVRLQDNTILEGHFPAEGYKIKFSDVKTVTLASRPGETGLLGLSVSNPGSDADFLKYLVDSKPEFKDAEGKPVVLDKSLISQLVKDARVKKQATIPFQSSAPLSFAIPPAKLASYDGTKAVFRDGTILEGKLQDDSMKLEADKIDLRRLILSSEKNVDNAFETVSKSDGWRVLGAASKEEFLKHKAAVLEKAKQAGKTPNLDDADFVREAFVMSIGHGEGHGHHATTIEKKDIAFYSNFTPKYHNYFAIYFVMTSLHGLHIIGGAIVLAYFLFFDKKIYLKDPEHLANRVEVGGLFWHFVDVIWMILFPVLYLM